MLLFLCKKWLLIGGNKMKFYENKKTIILFLAPALAFMSVFIFYPFFMNIIKSFYDSDGYTHSAFIGLDNYRRMLEDKTLRTAVVNTFIIMAYVVVFEIGIALILAVLVNGIKKAGKFFQTVYFFPIVISATAIGMMFNLIYAYNGGLLNNLITKFGGDPVVFKTIEGALTIVAIPTIWQYIGFYFVLLITAIRQIPKSLYESALIDGCAGFNRLRYITIPLIRNVLITCLVLAVTGALKVFDLVLVITGGGPLNSSQVLGLYMYQKTFTDEAFGYGSAISVLIVVIGLVVSFAVTKIFKKKDFTY
jgi:raffinose/stachyose/melibiose transport system permease protein